MLKWLLIPCCLLAQNAIEQDTLLYQAEVISQKYGLQVAKLQPPLPSPQPQGCLNTASIWFSLNLDDLKAPAFETLNNEGFWEEIKELGVGGMYLKGLKKGGQFRTGMGLDPKWGSDWNEIALWLQKKNIALIGDALGNSTGLSTDFGLALKNYGPYPGLYHLVEIDPKDWKGLPEVSNQQLFANVPWLQLQELYKKGYVPEAFAPYTKESRWNATGKIKCFDGKVRRWIYLQENRQDPAIDWLNSSFGGSRIAAADTLDSVYNLGQKIAKFADSVALDTQTLWTRKLGSFSVLETDLGLEAWKAAPTDLIFDNLTQRAVLHAFVTEDAEALKLIYSTLLNEGIEIQRLVHALQPVDDWKLFLLQPKKQFKYHDEVVTGELLRMRLLKEDLYRLDGKTWPSYCMATVSAKEFEKKRDEVLRVHLLSAFFYAMQPGAFSFSLSDLLGMTSLGALDLMGPNENSLYGSLPSQTKNTLSFTSQLKKILSCRMSSDIANGEIIAIPQTKQKNLLIFIQRVHGMLQLLAVNFGKTGAEQMIEMPEFRQTTAIDLMTGLAEKKPLVSSTIRLELPALSGKVILFQPQYYQ